jgi:hypothetical protein
LFDAPVRADTAKFPLDSTRGLTPHGVVLGPETWLGRKGLRVAVDPEFENAALPAGESPETLVVLDGTDFGDGVIEAEIAGDVYAGADEASRGFVGIAFRVQPDRKAYDAFYLRPRNGRDRDQLRRNHTTQYISHPEWTWSRLRQESPGVYESYVDATLGTWTRVRIEVDGMDARLYVHGATQPALVVHDLKSGATKRGAVALWLAPDTVAHFRNLRITTAATPAR